MSLIASILLLALTRAEIIERFKTPPATKLEGLVQVHANCPTDMRREYQLPVASYVADTCKSLYDSLLMRPERFDSPGIVVVLGDVRTNDSSVVSRVCKRGSGEFTRVYLPAPGFSNMRRLRIETAKAFFLAVKGEKLDDAAALKALLAADPEWRAVYSCEVLADWFERGTYDPGMDDEAYLKLQRKVLLPGQVSPLELRIFAARLFLQPMSYDVPFCGTYHDLDFGTAIRLRGRDPSIRFAAYVKSKQVLIFGAGRGEALSDVAQAYSEFLMKLAGKESTDGELLAMLADAEGKLKGVLP